MLSHLLGIEISVLGSHMAAVQLHTSPAGLLPTGPDLLPKDNDVPSLNMPAILP